MDNIAVFPNFGQNPYQILLYAGFPGKIFLTDSIFEAIRLVRLGHAGLVHIHWEEAFGQHTGASGQALAADQFIAVLVAYLDAGGRFVWTVHNERPHAPKDIDAFRRVRAFLAANAALIHVHSHAAAVVVGQICGATKARIILVPHPSYLGYFDPAPLTSQAPERNHCLSFGRVQPYKGIDRLIAGFAALPDGFSGVRLHIAGSAPAGYAVDTAPIQGRFAVAQTLRRIPDRKVPDLFANTDFLVLSHAAGLTSGTAMLGVTFGVPVIAPDIGGLRENLPRALDRLIYDAAEPAGLCTALETAFKLPPEERRQLRQACLDHARSLCPKAQSQKLYQEMQRRGLIPAAG